MLVSPTNDRRWTSCIAALGAIACISAAEGQEIQRFTLVGANHVRIGSADGPPETTFSGVVGAFLLEADRIVVADGGNQVLRFFDLRGEYLHSLGREGEGPSEFRVVRWLGLCGGLLVAGDPVLGRISIIAPDGDRLLRTEALPAWVFFHAFTGCDSSRNLYILLNEPAGIGPLDAVTRAPGMVARFRVGSEEREDLLSLPGTDWYFASRPRGFGPLPLGARAHAAVGGGRLFGAHSDALDVHVIDLATGRASMFQHELPRRPATPALREASLQAILESYPLTRTRALVDSVMAGAPIPADAPFFTDVVADRTGHVWLREPSAAATTLWHVYAADGRPLVTVRLESNVRPLDIGERHVVALETDPLGVQYVRVYRFTGPMLGLPTGN